jgi:hypothetical protein
MVPERVAVWTMVFTSTCASVRVGLAPASWAPDDRENPNRAIVASEATVTTVRRSQAAGSR